MQNVKEKVILRILEQESLNLKLWLERYEDLKFQGYFVKFLGIGTSMELFSNSRGLAANFRTAGQYTKVQGLICNFPKNKEMPEFFLNRATGAR
jgi:hypothetical protein